MFPHFDPLTRMLIPAYTPCFKHPGGACYFTYGHRLCYDLDLQRNRLKNAGLGLQEGDEGYVTFDHDSRMSIPVALHKVSTDIAKYLRESVVPDFAGMKAFEKWCKDWEEEE
jgi:hypothetical protein